MGRAGQAEGDHVFEAQEAPGNNCAVCPRAGAGTDEAVASCLDGPVEGAVVLGLRLASGGEICDDAVLNVGGVADEFAVGGGVLASPAQSELVVAIFNPFVDVSPTLVDEGEFCHRGPC